MKLVTLTVGFKTRWFSPGNQIHVAWFKGVERGVAVRELVFKLHETDRKIGIPVHMAFNDLSL